MNTTEFWTLIDASRTAAMTNPPERENFLVLIGEALEASEPNEILDFQRELYTQFNKTLHWDVVAAAAIIFGEDCDELDVEGFRFWLVSRGEAEMNRILGDIDSLADLDLVSDQVYYYELGQIGFNTYEEVSGEDLPLDSYPKSDDEPKGEEFTVQDLVSRLPKLADNFGLLPPPPELAAANDASSDAEFDAIMADVSDEENPYSEE